MIHSQVAEKGLIEEVAGIEISNRCCIDPQSEVFALLIFWINGERNETTAVKSVCCLQTVNHIETKFFDPIEEVNDHKKDLVDYIDLMNKKGE